MISLYYSISENKMAESKTISSDETYEIMKRFPKIELSYETIPHKKVSPNYNICLTIVQGKKGYIWFSFYDNEDVCFFMEINREKKVCKMRIIDIEFDRTLSLGTILHGTLTEMEGKKPIFVIEDLIFYKGVTMKYSLFKERLGFLERFFQKDLTPFRIEHAESNRSNPFINSNEEGILNENWCKKQNKNGEIIICLPAMWSVSEKSEYECQYLIPNFWKSRIIQFPIHHIQYRCLSETSPYMNVFNQNVFTNANMKKDSIYKLNQHVKMIVENFTKPQFKLSTVFLVTADIQFDIYHLFVYGKGGKNIYYNVAYIPNYKTSVFMNGIFRKIRENENLDYIEESEDEDDFENTDEDKYVDLEKTVMMECVFSQKYKKWVPRKIVHGQKVVHVSQLTNYY